MAEYVTLIGADDVKSAGHRMTEAAAEMKRAVDWMDESLQRHQRFLEDWLLRLEQVVESAGKHGRQESGS